MPNLARVYCGARPILDAAGREIGRQYGELNAKAFRKLLSAKERKEYERLECRWHSTRADFERAYRNYLKFVGRIWSRLHGKLTAE